MQKITGVVAGSIFLLGFVMQGFAQSKGTITGFVRDNENEVLPGVTVKIEGGSMNTGTVSQIDGSYQMELNPGEYTLSFSYVSFETKKITDIDIQPGKITELNIVLRPGKTSALSEVVVSASYKQNSTEGLLHNQKNSASISDGISADQIKRTPDNNAAQVLKRVSGLTIQDSKFVTVRGMSERYNNVMLNNSALPSTEPNRRNFSFDILPSNLIDNVVVHKTASPDLPGEFAGGVVMVTTKDVPVKDYINFSFGTGYNSLSAGRSMLSIKRSSSEFAGKAGDNRDWWEKGWNDNEYKTLLGSGVMKAITDYDKKIPNNWGLYQYNYSPVQQYQLSGGKVKKLKNDAILGLVLAATYRHDEFRTEEATRFRIADYDLSGESFDVNTSAAVLANFAYQDKHNKIGFKNLFNRKFNHSTQVLSGALTSSNSYVSAYTDIMTANNLYQNRLEGEHNLGSRKIKIGWHLDRSQLKRLQPDMRNSIAQEGRYGLGEAQGAFGLSGGGLSVMNAKLKEERINYGAYTQIPFKILGRDHKIKLGYQGANRNADFIFSGMKMQYTPHSDLEDDLYGRPDYFIADPDFLRANGLLYKTAGPSYSNDPEAYKGEQNLHAFYAMADLKLLSKLRFIGGARMEQNNVTVDTRTYSFDNKGNPIVKIEKKEYKSNIVLPSFNLVYSLNDKMNIRGAYSKTLARPDFRERSTFLYFDFYDYTPYKGITGLKDTRTDNIDLRYECYPKPGEVLSASVFYKKFLNPVELVQQISSGSNSAVNFYFNLANSTNYGIEADFRKSLGFLSQPSKFLRNLFISGNASYMKSQVKYDIPSLTAAAAGLNPDSLSSADEIRQRPLQGLSPYIINGAISYQDNKWGIQVSYNRFGERLVTGAPFAFQDQYEKARDVIDLQLSGKFWKNRMEIRLNISDLLQQPFIVYQNAGASSDGQTEIENNHDPKENKFNENLDVIRLKTYRGSNIGLSIGIQL